MAAIDPFADVRGKTIGELTAEQKDLATELWLRTQIGPSETYWHPHLQALFRVIDRLRADPHQAEWVAVAEAAGVVGRSGPDVDPGPLCQALDRLSAAIMQDTDFVPEAKTLATAPKILNNNDAAMWVLGWNECRDAMLAPKGG